MLVPTGRAGLGIVSVAKVLMQIATMLALHKNITQRIEILHWKVLGFITEEQLPLVKEISGDSHVAMAVVAFVVVPHATLSWIDCFAT